MSGLACAILLPSAFSIAAVPLWASHAETADGQAEIAVADSTLPDAPGPQTPASKPDPKPPCSAMAPSTTSTSPALSGSAPAALVSPAAPAVGPCATPPTNWYTRFVRGSRDKPLTPKDKAWLAARNLADPFNNVTILGEAGISVAADPHSPYGPGMPGYARYVGVSYTQDLIGEFLGTFLIPSIAHQDPRYHRMPEAKIPRRVFHAITQVVWTEGDSGKGMPNYANLVGFAFDDEIGNLYVPGRKTDALAASSRYAIGLASAPIGNLVNEFLPDVARHIHIEIVILQRVINQVARTESGQ